MSHHPKQQPKQQNQKTGPGLWLGYIHYWISVPFIEPVDDLSEFLPQSKKAKHETAARRPIAVTISWMTPAAARVRP